MELHISLVKQRYKTWDPITIAGQTVDVTDEFTNLGSDIDSSGYCGSDTYVGGCASPHPSWNSSTESGEIRG